MTEHDTPLEPIRIVPKKLSAKEIAFCWNLLDGMQPKEAALKSGFKLSIATQASRWVRESRERSNKPWMFDYFAEILKKKLRLFDITADSVLNELKIIGFSDIMNFIDIPSKAELEQDALEARRLNFDVNQADQAVEWKKLRAGSYIRLKSRDQIPPQLTAAISELSETKDGIKIKLHPKIPALLLMAKHLALLSSASADPDEAGQSVKEINLIVEGSKSPLMKLLQGGAGELEKKAG